MEIGKRLYYLKSCGDIVFDSGEVSGDVRVKPTLEQDLILGNLTHLDREEIGIIELKFGEYAQEFIDNDACRVNVENGELYFINRKYNISAYVPSEDIPFYTEGKIVELYNEHYLFNIKNLARVQDKLRINYKWLTIEEIRIKPTILAKSWDFYFEDAYLKDCVEDKTYLAREIVDNGTFWPVVCQEMLDDKGYMTAEGTHRLISLKLLDLYEGLPGFKLLSLIIRDRYDNFKHNATSELIGFPIRQRIPYVVKYDYLKKDDPITINNMKSNGYIFVDKEREVMEFTAKTYTDVIYANQIFPHWLRDIFYRAREEYGLEMKGADIINNEESWEEMLRCSVRSKELR